MALVHWWTSQVMLLVKKLPANARDADLIPGSGSIGSTIFLSIICQPLSWGFLVCIKDESKHFFLFFEFAIEQLRQICKHLGKLQSRIKEYTKQYSQFSVGL